MEISLIRGNGYNKMIMCKTKPIIPPIFLSTARRILSKGHSIFITKLSDLQRTLIAMFSLSASK